MEGKGEKVTISPDWKQMPRDMLELFCQQLNIVEQVRFGSVCKTWYSATSNKANIWVPDTPWLITSEDSSSKYYIYSPTLQKSFKIHKPYWPINGSFVAGSYKGWLIIRSEHRISVLNIFSQVQIELPPRSTMPDLIKSNGIPMRIPTVFTILTCHNLNPIIVACVTFGGDIAWCKIGDQGWKGHRGGVQYANLTFHNDNLYAINKSGNRIDIYQVDDESSLLIPLDTIRATIPTVDPSNVLDVYLVESKGSLLVIKRYYDNTKILGPTIGFDIYKIQENNCSSPQLINVDSLEDQALFLSNLGCESLPAKHCSGLERPCIYFISHSHDNYNSELGVFSVDDANMFTTPLCNHTSMYPPIWVLPRHAFACDCKGHNSTMWKPDTTLWKPKYPRRKNSKPKRLMPLD